MRDTDKSRYFAITEFNNGFIIRSPSLFSHLNLSLTAEGSDLPFFIQECGYNYAWAEYYLEQVSRSKLHLDVITREQTIIREALTCRSSSALSPNEKKGNVHRTIVSSHRAGHGNPDGECFFFSYCLRTNVRWIAVWDNGWRVLLAINNGQEVRADFAAWEKLTTRSKKE